MSTETTDIMWTGAGAAAVIVAQMSRDDVESFDADAWRDGISAMLDDEWAGLDLDGVLSWVCDLVDRKRETLGIS